MAHVHNICTKHSEQYPLKIRNIYFPDSVKIVAKMVGIFNDN